MCGKHLGGNTDWTSFLFLHLIILIIMSIIIFIIIFIIIITFTILIHVSVSGVQLGQMWYLKSFENQNFARRISLFPKMFMQLILIQMNSHLPHHKETTGKTLCWEELCKWRCIAPKYAATHCTIYCTKLYNNALHYTALHYTLHPSACPSYASGSKGLLDNI